MVIPEGHVWLAGDNTYNSSDSRIYGPMPIGMLQGRVFFKFGLYPFHASSIDHIVLKDKYNGMKYDQQDPNKQCYYVSKDRNVTVLNDHDHINNNHHHTQQQQSQLQLSYNNTQRNKENNTYTITQSKGIPVGMNNKSHDSYNSSNIRNDCNRGSRDNNTSSDDNNDTSNRHISSVDVDKIVKP